MPIKRVLSTQLEGARIILPIVLALCVFASPALADKPNFHHWFPKYRSYFEDATRSCAEPLQEYWTFNRTRNWSVCAKAADCLLEHTTESIKTNMQGAAVILGLTPGILAFIGPTVTEVAVLSVRHPFLALLLPFGAPAIRIQHLFSREEEVTQRMRLSVEESAPSLTSRAWHAWLKRQSPVRRNAMRIFEYAFVVAAIANAVHASIDLDYRTVSGFSCNQKFMPFMWNTFGVFIQLLGMFAMRRRGVIQQAVSSDSSERPNYGLWGSFWVCLNVFGRPKAWRNIVRGDDDTIGEIVFWFASLLAILHMFAGVLIFSGIVFIGAVDALPVSIRYTVSAAICQAVLLLELAGMRIDLSENGADEQFHVGTHVEELTHDSKPTV